MVPKLKSLASSILFSKETSNVLNYLTLRVKDQTLQSKIYDHRAQEFDKLKLLFNVFAAFNLV